MSHRDQDSVTSPGTNAQAILSAMEDLWSNVDWSGVQFRKDCQWSVRGLVMAALVWAWSSNRTLTGRFARSLRIVRRLGRRFAPSTLSYQGFLEVLVRWTPTLRTCLMLAFQARMAREFPSEFRFGGFVVIAADGSKLLLPRTVSNQARYAPARTRRNSTRKRRKSSVRATTRKARERQSRIKKAESPQMAMTALLHVGLRLPWDWRLGSSDTSEREQLRSMIAGLPPDALLVADCGFFGYEFWSELLASGRHFVIRVGGNVRLLKKLGLARESRGTVYLWPNHAAQRRQQPLVLRLVQVHDGRQSWFLVTSVLDRKCLSDSQVAQIYARRWRVELFFRHLKQTFNRAKLRSHKAEHAECEAEWSLLGLWGMLLDARLQQRQHPARAERISVARVLRAFAQAIDEYKCRPDDGESLHEQLQAATLDPYRRRNQQSRGYPRRKYETNAKPPLIFHATTTQRQFAQQLRADSRRKALTA